MKTPKSDSADDPVDQEIFVEFIEPYYPPALYGWQWRLVTLENLRREFYPEIETGA